MATALPPLIEDLRRRLVTEPLKRDPRSSPGSPLGLTYAQAAEVIGWGQANFDEPFGALSAEDRALLYAYWNQKRHLEELTEAFNQLFDSGRPNKPLIVVDWGCGPFTGGLALAGQFGRVDRIDYIGIDRSQVMRRLGERFAAAAELFDGAPQIERHWAAGDSEIGWGRPLGWRPVLVIVSFLLSSDSVDAVVLVEKLEALLDRLSRGETTVVYTNSPKDRPNRNFPAFQNALARAGFRMLTDDIGRVSTGSRTLELRYALFRRGPQRQLPLGGG